MKWIYHARQKWFPDGDAAHQEVYMRPRFTDENGHEYEGKIIDIHIFSLGFLFGKQIFEKDEHADYYNILTNELSKKDYFFEFIDVPETNEVYLNWARLFIDAVFNKVQLEKWLRLYLAIMGYPCDAMMVGTYNDFADTNALIRLFSVENVKKFEPKFGEEWWKPENKDKHPKTNHQSDHQSDQQLIDMLLTEIKENKN